MAWHKGNALSTRLLYTGRISTWMGDCLQAEKPSWNVTSRLGQLSLSSFWGRYIEYRPIWLGLRRGGFTSDGSDK